MVVDLVVVVVVVDLKRDVVKMVIRWNGC